MAAMTERPFTEPEKLYLLAEILKDAQLPSDVFLRIIRDANIKPRWNEIPLPPGRSLKSCQAVFKGLMSVPAVGPIQRAQASPSEPSPTIPRKRPAPTAADTPTIGQRAIQPRPAFIASVNGRNDPLMQNIAAETGSGPPKKKRGRPSKADLETRAAEAAARGEVVLQSPQPAFQKPERPSEPSAEPPRPAAPSRGAPMAAMLSPAEGVPESASSAANKKRGRASGVAGKPEGPTATASTERVIPETQESEFAAPASLLAGMRERAAQVDEARDTPMKGSDPVDSSGTLYALSGRSGDGEQGPPKPR